MTDGDTTANFRIGDAFPSDDPSARYVARLSVALGDLRIAADPLIRRGEEITDYERFYFVRLLASHMYETVLLITPRGRRSVLPRLDEFLAEFGDREPKTQHVIRQAHAELIRQLGNPFQLRPHLTVEDELKRLRNQFFHYSFKTAQDDTNIQRALEAAADVEGVYRNRPRDNRALYADEIAHHLMHPFDVPDEEFPAVLRELHEAITNLVGPITRFVLNVEALYLYTRPRGVVRVIWPDGRVQAL